MLLIRRIRALLYEEGYTIEGARQTLAGKKTQIVTDEAKKLPIHAMLSLTGTITHEYHQ